MTMLAASTPWQRTWHWLLREPMVHFFGLGAALFIAHRLLVGDPRVITVTPGLRAELARRFEDQNGKAPSPAELQTALHDWERDEALFREALRAHLDRDDPSVRSAMVDKMHGLAAFQVPKRQPTEAELSGWLATHRSLYETPLRYDFEFFAFPKAEPAARAQLSAFARALAAGANPTTLGRPLLGGSLSAPEMKDRIEPELAAFILSLPSAEWRQLEGKEALLLARLKHVSGGLPSQDELRPRLIEDCSFALKQAAVERILQQTLSRYRVEADP